MTIPFFELKRQYFSIQAELDYAVRKVMRNGLFTLGPEVGAFENEFAEYIGTSHAIGVASGTDALTMAVTALGLKSGDEVIVPANSYPTAFGIAKSGVTLRLADVDGNGVLDHSEIRRAITKRTKAVVAVHLYGNLCDVFRIKDVLSNFMPQRIHLIEDAAQAHGALLHRGFGLKSAKAGSVGDISVFSFYPTKNLGAYGDGGLLVTDRFTFGKLLRQLRQYGEKTRYESEMVSGVSRLDELQAAVLRVKLRYLDEWNKRRREIAAQYMFEFEGVGDIRFVSQSAGTGAPSYHLFVIATRLREKLREFLMKSGVGCAVHYPVPIHLTPAFRRLTYKKGAFPVSERLSREVLSLPIYPELTDREVGRIIKTVKAFFAGGKDL